MTNNIIIIEVENSSKLLRDMVKVITETADYHCTCLRIEPSTHDEKILSFPGLSINLEQYTVMMEGELIAMNGYEFQALAYLAGNSGHVFTKEMIYNAVYGEERIVDVDNSIYCLIRNIRKKLNKNRGDHQYIQTIRGVGYKFVAPKE